MSALQGAGAWLAGTSTTHPRAGNKKLDILHPFLSLPRSRSAVNWLGLPNDGHFALAGKISRIEKISGCPIGVSVSSDPSESGLTAMKSLVDGMDAYSQSSVDFIELNESCPNVPHHSNSDSNTLDKEMVTRLEYIGVICEIQKKYLPVMRIILLIHPNLLDD